MRNELSSSAQLKLFGMRNLMLESELAKLEKDGIELNHIRTIKKDELVDTDLFDFNIRKSATKMADFYALYYCIENTIRQLIIGRLSEKHGHDWWDKAVPQGVKLKVKERQEKEKDTPISMRDEPILYASFGEYIDIFNANWSEFSDTIRSQKSMQQTLGVFNQLRNIIAHSSELNDDEIMRFTLLIRDWMRIQM